MPLMVLLISCLEDSKDKSKDTDCISDQVLFQIFTLAFDADNDEVTLLGIWFMHLTTFVERKQRNGAMFCILFFRAKSEERQREKRKLTHDDTSEANLFWSSFELLLIFHSRSWSLSLSGTLVTHHDFVFFTDQKDSEFKETSLFNDMQRI